MAFKWSTSVSAVRTCRNKTARRSTSACRQSVSARRRSSVRKAHNAPKKSARGPTAKSPQIRGEGDATRNQIFAEAFGQDPDFFAFYRSMQAYERGLKQNDTRMLLKPDSSFFRYFTDPSGKQREKPTAP